MGYATMREAVEAGKSDEWSKLKGFVVYQYLGRYHYELVGNVIPRRGFVLSKWHWRTIEEEWYMFG